MTTHREQYPEQYIHQLVGRQVRIGDKTGIVGRVVDTRFGKLAILEGDNETAYALDKCEVLEGGNDDR